MWGGGALQCRSRGDSVEASCLASPGYVELPPLQPHSRILHQGRSTPQSPPAWGFVLGPFPPPSLPPRLAWHRPTPPTPACSRTIFQMDVSILLLVIKARGQRCLAQLCTEGARHSPDPPSFTAQGSSFPHAQSGQVTGSCSHSSIPGWQQVQCPTQISVPPGVSLEEPTPIAVPASALSGLMLAAGWLLALAEVGTEQDLEWGDSGVGMAWGGGKGARKWGVLTACAQPARGPHSPRKKSPAERG